MLIYFVLFKASVKSGAPAILKMSCTKVSGSAVVSMLLFLKKNPTNKTETKHKNQRKNHDVLTRIPQQ